MWNFHKNNCPKGVLNGINLVLVCAMNNMDIDLMIYVWSHYDVNKINYI